jgi:hypothetical protein
MRITARLEGTSAHDTGSAIVYANGVSGVSYEYVPPLHASRIGDQVSSTLRILYRVAERFHESFAEGGWNFHVIPVVPGH